MSVHLVPKRETSQEHTELVFARADLRCCVASNPIRQNKHFEIERNREEWCW